MTDIFPHDSDHGDGACTGLTVLLFVPLNRPAARLFMGDVRNLPIGLLPG